jgi:hypothetical protein
VDAVAASLYTKGAVHKGRDRKATCAELCRDGGQDFVNFMLAQAVGTGTESHKLPN